MADEEMRNRKRRKTMSEINIVPYIDVMLVLLVIFMITAPLLSQGVKVDLPRAQAQALSVKHQEPIIVSIDKQGQYYLNISAKPDVPVNPYELVNRIAAQKLLDQQTGEETSVFVKGDKDVYYEKVVQAMVLVQQAGIEKVGLMTESPKDKDYI